MLSECMSAYDDSPLRLVQRSRRKGKLHVLLVSLFPLSPPRLPPQEPRRKLLHSTKLKPILIGVNSKGVLRVDHKTKEILDMWDYQVLKNWAYSKRTFVLVSVCELVWAVCVWAGGGCVYLCTFLHLHVCLH